MARDEGRQPFLFLVSDGKPTVSDQGLELENAFERVSYKRDLPIFALAIRPDGLEAENLLRNLSHYNGGTLVTVKGGNLPGDLADAV